MRWFARNKPYVLTLMPLLLLCAGIMFVAKDSHRPKPVDKLVFANSTSYVRDNLSEYEHKALAGDAHAAAALVDYSWYALRSEKQVVKWLEVATRNGDKASRLKLGLIYIGRDDAEKDLDEKYIVTPESCAQGRQLLQQAKEDGAFYSTIAASVLSGMSPNCGLGTK